MKRFPSIKKNKDFLSIYSSAGSYANKHLVMYKRENGKKYNRLGISVSKKVGNSVVRHRLARLMREIFRLNDNKIRQGFDVIVIIRPSCVLLPYKDIEKSFLHLYGLHKLIED